MFQTDPVFLIPTAVFVFFAFALLFVHNLCFIYNCNGGCVLCFIACCLLLLCVLIFPFNAHSLNWESRIRYLHTASSFHFDFHTHSHNHTHTVTHIYIHIMHLHICTHTTLHNNNTSSNNIVVVVIVFITFLFLLSWCYHHSSFTLTLCTHYSLQRTLSFQKVGSGTYMRLPRFISTIINSFTHYSHFSLQ